MSIRKTAGEFVCECSECGTEEYGGIQDDFKKFVSEIKDLGWRIKKEGEEWIHLCPGCYDKE